MTSPCSLWMWTGTRFLCDYFPSHIQLHGVSQSGFIWDGAYKPMTTKISLPMELLRERSENQWFSYPTWTRYSSLPIAAYLFTGVLELEQCGGFLSQFWFGKYFKLFLGDFIPPEQGDDKGGVLPQSSAIVALCMLLIV